jgi:UDP-N-acetylmuramoyl-L-alanyl-D-glutamate--2,6-diaminopimelate ligase
MRSMALVDLVDAAGVPAEVGPLAGGGPRVDAVVHDTRQVGPGTLFCCIPGQRVDGHDLAGEAVDRGAVALLVEHPVDLSGGVDVPQVVVPDVRRALGPYAAAFWGAPSQRLDVVGVTGTAGKTTVTQLVQAVLATAGRRCATIGTLSGARTTPEATELQAELGRLADSGTDAVAMEVSSHGLDLHRVDGTWFSVAVFTNLSRDHLDFHPSMEAYFGAKARLFRPERTGRAVICTDDEWGRRLAEEVRGADDRLQVRTYSIADAENLVLDASGARFTWRGTQVAIGLAGRFNVANALAAATVADLLGVSRDVIVAGLAAAGPASGRFERVEAGQGFTVLVDYAHKPEALEQALAAARDLVDGERGRVTVVFGCGGDRDTGKRPLMGAVAERLADRVVVTSDNPRSEDPDAIIAEVTAGMETTVGVDVEPDRYRALELALTGARPGDVVVIAGKGHERHQIIGGQRLPFDDCEQVQRTLLALEEGH